MAVDEPADELAVAHRGRPDDDPRHAGLGERLRSLEVADPAAGLDLHGEAVRDLLDVREIRRPSGPGAVQVDDVQPLRALGDKPFRRLERRRGDVLGGGEVPLGHADAAAIEDVDRRIDDHLPLPRATGAAAPVAALAGLAAPVVSAPVVAAPVVASVVAAAASGEGAQEPQPVRAGLLGVELHAEQGLTADDRQARPAVVDRAEDDVVVGLGGVAVDEVEVVAVPHLAQPGVGAHQV